MLKQAGALLVALWSAASLSAQPGSQLENCFAHPPESAKPRTYWFHMSGNISKPGITADLEAMKQIGLGGTLFMNVSVAMPTGLVATKDFMTPAWQDCFQHMLNESARLGLDFGSALCDGWGNAGGPDIPPELAMQQLAWSDTSVRGGESIEVAKLPQPPSQLDYYRDIAVLAFPTPPGDQAAPPPSIKNISLKRPANGFADIRFDFRTPATVCELTLTDIGGQNPFGNPTASIEASDNGTAWRLVKKFPTSWRGHPRTDLTIAFDPATAQQFRVRFSAASFFRAGQFTIAEASLSAKQRVHYWQAKSAIISHNEHGGGAERFLDPGATDAPGIPLANIIDLTGKDKWTAPEGNWTVVRIGHTPTGAHNAPATEAGVGLECDKLNPRGIEAQQAAFVDRMLAAATPAGKRAYKHTWIDSWEVGPQNWTASFADEFKARHGYDLTRWLPVVAGGRILGSRDQSERVLWDFRRTIADLFTENYWRHAMELARQRGIEFRAESFGRQQFMYDPMNYARACDMPCGEFWVNGGPRVDCKVAASAAHLSGRQIAGAEAFTSGRGNWTDDPWSLKTLGDRAFCLGVNQYYFHRYAHQPWTNLVPGMTFGPYGINFERTSTWWKEGRAWVEYLTRCQSLLQQGRFVADALVMLDEGAPSYGGWREQLAIPLPAGYDYDFANLAALRQSHVEGGTVVHTNGMRYRVLMLPGTGRATLALLREVLRLAEAGATIAAPRPLNRAHGLTADAEAETLWNKITATGHIVVAESFTAVEQKIGLTPDFAREGDTELLWIHRTDAAGADWYFVSNQGDKEGDILCTFRVTGRQPELWDAATGRMRNVAQFEEGAGQTRVLIPFDPRGSWFVVFRKPASPLAVRPAATPRRALRIEDNSLIEATELPGGQVLDKGWDVTFQPGRGAPASVHLNHLMDMARHADEGVRHFSGTMTYRTRFVPNQKPEASTQQEMLDLGEVGNLAEVIVNGHNLGVLWKRPFRVDITSALQDGANELEVRVTDLWVNRLIGDAKQMAALGIAYRARNGVISKWPAWVTQDAPPADAPVSFATWRQWNGDEALQPSGLIGPVMLRTIENIYVH